MHLFPIGLLAALLFSPIASAQNNVSDQERRLMEDLSLQKYTVGYKDAQGKRIDFDTFNKAVLAGQHFSQFKNPQAHTAVLALDSESDHPGHAHPADSQVNQTMTFATPGSGAQPGVIRINEEEGERAFSEGLGIQGYATSYTSADGDMIDFASFSARIAEGHEFSITKDAKQKRAVLALGTRHEESAVSTPNPAMSGDATRALPDFTLSTTDGRVVSNATLNGGTTLLSFYFAECLPCIREIPMLNDFARNNPQMNLFAVTFDDLATTTRFQAEHGLDWSILPDAQAFIDSVGIKTYPTMVLVDARGTIRASHSGVQRLTDEKQLKAWVDESLAATASP